MRNTLFAAALLFFISCNNSGKKTEEKKDSLGNRTVVPEKPAIPDTIFTGTGTEPFWAVYIINNDKIVYHPAEGPDISVPYVAPTATDSITSKYSSANDSVTMELSVIKKDCNNGMSDQVYPCQVTLLINAASFKGCGKYARF